MRKHFHLLRSMFIGVVLLFTMGAWGQIDPQKILSQHEPETAVVDQTVPVATTPAPVDTPMVDSAEGEDFYLSLIERLTQVLDRFVTMIEKLIGVNSGKSVPSVTDEKPAIGKKAPGKSPTAKTAPEKKSGSGVAKGTGAPLKVRATGYFPPSSKGYKSKAEAAMEGGGNDCRGNKLRTLQDYNKNDPKDYVSCATDPRVIRTGTFFTLDQFPGVRFYACDVGGGIKGNHIDICCKNEHETFKLPSSVTVRKIK